MTRAEIEKLVYVAFGVRDRNPSRLPDLITKLLDSRDELRAALEFYANEDHYKGVEMKVTKVDQKKGIVTFGNQIDYGTKALLDAGETARNFLKADDLRWEGK